MNYEMFGNIFDGLDNESDSGIPGEMSKMFSKTPICTEEYIPENIYETISFKNAGQESPQYLKNFKLIIPNKWHVGLVQESASTVFNFLRVLNIKYKIHEMSDHVFKIDNLYHTNENILSMQNGIITFTYDGIEYIFSKYTIDELESDRMFMACPDFDALHKMLRMIQIFFCAAKSKFLIFDGQWSYNNKMQEGLTDYTWDSLIMKAETKDAIKEDVEKFFNGGNEIYKKLGIPYKRGSLFIGPPGCGKSLTAKIIANEFNYTFIYVVAIRSEGAYEEHNIKEVFKQARKCAPCIVLFEDIDALISTSENDINNPVKTYFLNSMDGFFSNEGVLVIATTNKPQNIDTALLNRPSRFDRKYEFCMPDEKYRKLYIENKLKNITNDVDSIKETIHRIAKDSSQHSYAMLQELVLTASYDHITNNKNLSESLESALRVTKEQVMFGKSNGIIDKMNDKKPTGFRDRHKSEEE